VSVWVVAFIMVVSPIEVDYTSCFDDFIIERMLVKKLQPFSKKINEISIVLPASS